MQRELTLQDIYRARQRIAGLTLRTPLVRSESLSRRWKCEAWLKLDCLQPTGAFKLRGAVNALLGLDAAQRKRAIELFQRGAASDFKMEAAVAAFLQACGPQRQLQQTLLLFLISLAQADQGIEVAEHAALVRIANLMGLGAAQLEQLLRMARAQDSFHQQGDRAAPSSTFSLEHAYTALGIASTASDKEVKRAYRKQMSENHPDKLIAKGVPEEMIKLATTRSQEIQNAYEVIKKTRPAMR